MVMNSTKNACKFNQRSHCLTNANDLTRTPWLVTRRRTCPICKGDVVRSLSQAHSDRNLRSRSRSPSRVHRRSYNGDSDSLQVQAAETRNDSPSAARPIDDDFEADVEANWLNSSSDAEAGRAREDPDRERGLDLGASLREVGSSIWRGFDALRDAAGLQRRTSSREELDRDR